MKKQMLVLEIADLVLLLLSLYFHNDILLIVAAVVMAICIILTFANYGKKRNKTQEIITMENSQEPSMDNLPNGEIDWTEISAFIEDMLEPDIHCRKGWKIINDSSMTEKLQENSRMVLMTLYDDLYGYFYKQHEGKFEVWQRMEKFIRTKYNGLSDKALSRVIGRYQIDDR